MKNSPIIVTGIERSGSTLIAKCLELSGAFTGKCSGRFENLRLKTLLDSSFSMSGYNPKNQYPIPDTNMIKIHNLKERIEMIMYQEGFTGEGAYMVKHAKIAECWSKWHEAFPNAKWVIVRRKPTEILNSCLLTSFMHSYADCSIQKEIQVENEREGWMWWIKQHENILTQFAQSGAYYKEVWPERMATGDYSQIYQLLEWLGLEWSDSIVEQIDPLLNKKRK